jgi:hypothetical protein
MNTPWLSPGLSLLLFLGAAAPILGLVRVIRPASGRSVPVTAAAAVLGILTGGFAAAAALAGQPASVWLPAALVGMWACLSLPCRPPLAPLVALVHRPLHAPAVQAACLLLGGPALALWWVLAGPAVDRPRLFAPPPAETVWVDFEEISPSPLRTDRRRSVRVARPTVPLRQGGAAARSEAVRALGLSTRVITLPVTGGDSNCHGWVFARGRHWVREESVEGILEDNGYRPAPAPRPGDLVIYRDPDGRIVHSAVVRAALRDAFVLVESKWGVMGVYLHAADVHPYQGSTATYHRSPRVGHHLYGVPDAALLGTASRVAASAAGTVVSAVRRAD